MLRSVEEVSIQLGISKTSIYNKIKLKEYKDKIIKKQGKTMVDDDLFNLIKASLKFQNNVETEINQDSQNEDIAIDLDSSFNLNKEFIMDLMNQIKEKDKQIEKLHELLAKSQSLIENNQVLLKQQQDKEMKRLQLEEHFSEVDLKLQDLREKMDERNKKGTDKKFFKFLKK